MTNYFSPQARIPPTTVIGENVKIYGPVVLENDTIIGHNVVIGHPSPEELNTHNATSKKLVEYYQEASKNETKLGAGSIIRDNTVIYSGCSLGRSFDCGHNVLIRENVKIGRNSYVMSNTEIKRDARIGKWCRVGGSVGDRTDIADYATMVGHTIHSYIVGIGGQIEPAPRIGRGATIGRHASVVGDVEVGPFALVAANSLVVKDVARMSVVGGNPARVLRGRSDDELVGLYSLIKESEKNDEGT